MRYAVKEIYYTLQGEGMHTGRSAVFLRFSGCNLWSGREEDRYQAICQFCDTDFWGTDGVYGGKYTAAELSHMVRRIWKEESSANRDEAPYVVCTGGEPLLQLDLKLISSLHDAGFEVAIETNGTLPVPAGVDWICMSPKAGTRIVATTGNELKYIFPQPGLDPAGLLALSFEHFLIQPMDGPRLEENTMAAIDYCNAHPEWQLSLQTHKMLAFP